jgi:hypothetical protein
MVMPEHAELLVRFLPAFVEQTCNLAKRLSNLPLAVDSISAVISTPPSLLQSPILKEESLRKGNAYPSRSYCYCMRIDAQNREAPCFPNDSG